MEVKTKVAAVYIRKYLLFSLESAYRLTCRHPFLASFVVSLFLLHSCHPFLFAFLVSSSPVLICTALLLGILLYYGEPYVPEIEEEDEFNGKGSSPNVEHSDVLFIKKDKSCILDGHADSRVSTREKTIEDWATDGKYERVDDFLAVRSSAEVQNKTGEDFILEHGLVKNMGDLSKEQSECRVGMSEVTDGGIQRVGDLILRINRPEFDECEFDERFDSYHGSSWQHINAHDAASDSESDRAESSSSDASMADILPLFSELHPLLGSKTPKSADNSDVELSQHHESDEDSAEQEDEHKIEESDAINKVVTWTADDQKNVMDLGSSDMERNRRLESLIARRRARKNQIIIFEQDLIDLHNNDMKVDGLSRFHPQIPHVFAPRRNPFDLHYESEGSKEYPPIPGSAPSVLVHRQNPFDIPSDSENDSKGLAGDNICQPEFVLPFRRGLSFRRHESFASQSLFPSNVMDGKHGSSSSSRFKPCLIEETNEHVDSDSVSSSIDPKHQKELAEHKMHEDTELPVSIHDATTGVQDGQSCRDDLVDFDPELVEDGHFVDSNVSAVSEEYHRNVDASGTGIVSLMFDGLKHEMDEEKHDEWTLFTSLEDKENIGLHEELESQVHITSFSEGIFETAQPSDAYDCRLFREIEIPYNSQTVVPDYDSSPSGSGNFISNIYVPEEALHSLGIGSPISTPMESHLQDNIVDVASHARAFRENMTSEMREFEIFSARINVLDEDVLTTKEKYERVEHDFTKNRSPGLVEDFGGLAISSEIDHSSGFSSRESNLNETSGLPKSDVEEKHRSLENFEMQAASGACNFELGPILEENSEDLISEGKILSSTTITASTTQQMLEEPNVCKSSIVQKVFSLQNESESAAGDDVDKKEIAFLREKDKTLKTCNLVSPKDDLLSGLIIGEFSDTMESSNLCKIRSEYEFTSIDDINDPQASDIDEFQINEDVILRKLNEFYTEPGDENAEVSEIQFFDESLLQELDTVGDFHVGLESQQCLRMESRSTNQLDCSSEDSELRSDYISDTSPKNPTSAYPNNPHVIDLELTVYKSKFNVLQAYSLEELDSTFKQAPDEEFAEHSLSETITDNYVAENPHVGLNRFDIFDAEIEAISGATTLLTEKAVDGISSDLTEAVPCGTTMSTGKIAGEISSDLIEDGRDFRSRPHAHDLFQLNNNQSSTDGCKADLTIVDACKCNPTERQSLEIKALQVDAVIPSTSGLTSYISAMDVAEASSTQLSISSRALQRGETDSELFVVKAKVIEDTDLAFKHASEIILNKSISSLVNPEPMLAHSNDNVVEAMPHEVEKTSGLLFFEAKSVEDINSAFREAANGGLAAPCFCVSDPSSSRTRTDFQEMESNSPNAEDIQLAFKQAIRGVSTKSCSPLVDPGLFRATQVPEVVEAVYPDMQDNSELLVTDGKSSEDIGCVFKQFDIEKMATHSNDKVEADESKPVNSENDTNDKEPLALGKKFLDATSAFQQATDKVYDKSAFHQVHPLSLRSRLNNEVEDVCSLETQMDLELSVLDTKSATLEHDNQECSVHSISKDDQELRYLQPGLDVAEKRSLLVEDKSGIFALELKPFEDSHLDAKEAAANFFCQSSTILVDPEHNPEQVVLDERSPVSYNNFDFIVESKSLENFNLSFEQAAKGCLVKSISKDDADNDAVKGSCFSSDNNSELVVVEQDSFVNIESAFSEATAVVCELSSSLLVDPRPIMSHSGENIDDIMCSEANNSKMLVLEEGSTRPSISKEPSALPVNHDVFMEENSLGKNEQELLVFEEKSVKDMDSTLKEVSEEYLGMSITLQDDFKHETPPVLPPKDSGLFILEPVSDSGGIVKQGTKKIASFKGEEGSTVSVNKEMDEHDYATIVVEASNRIHDTEVDRTKETAVVSAETVTSENRGNEDKMYKGIYEVEIPSEGKEEIVYKYPGSSAPTSLNTQKKKKISEKSDSSSTSSSSSSDSE